MGSPAVTHDEHHQRLETKLKRELGAQVLALLNDDRTEDILLNPDSCLWAKRMGEGFTRVGDLPTAQGPSALNTIAAWRKKSWTTSTPFWRPSFPSMAAALKGSFRRLCADPYLRFAFGRAGFFRWTNMRPAAFLAPRTIR
jgi:type IV secretion system protein TrbB